MAFDMPLVFFQGDAILKFCCQRIKETSLQLMAVLKYVWNDQSSVPAVHMLTFNK
jgi:hypothetical protein